MRVSRYAASPAVRVLETDTADPPQNVLARAYLAAVEMLDLGPQDVAARDQLLSALLERTPDTSLMPPDLATDWLVSEMLDRYQRGFPQAH